MKERAVLRIQQTLLYPGKQQRETQDTLFFLILLMPHLISCNSPFSLLFSFPDVREEGAKKDREGAEGRINIMTCNEKPSQEYFDQKQKQDQQQQQKKNGEQDLLFSVLFFLSPSKSTLKYFLNVQYFYSVSRRKATYKNLTPFDSYSFPVGDNRTEKKREEET